MAPTHGDTSWFVHDRFGLFIHWGTYALAARHEWVKNAEQIPDSEYRKYFEHFDPDLYDPREWARMARQAGMKYFVVTSKHHEGFCLWDSQYTDYKATNAPCGRDLLTPLLEAFRDEGLKVGLYYSLLDWHHPDYTVDRFHPMRNNDEERARNAGRDMKRYAEYMRNQVRELLTGFGPIDILWFDFSFPGDDGKGRDDWESEKLYRLVRELQPNVIIDNRLDLPDAGDFVTPEQFQPATAPTDSSGAPVVWEACQTFSGSWGYHRDEQTWKSVEQLLWMLVDGVSKGGNLLLNVGPTARGEFDYRARERLDGIGQWMHHHGRAIYGCGPAPDGMEPPRDCRYTYNPETKRLYMHVLAWPFRDLYCPGLKGRVKYAQLLHDASEIRCEEPHGDQAGSSDALVLRLPVVKPMVNVPVVELFLS
ncbi:MAG: alpha-L-fucosidase [Chitinivibrionales bacterium]|nr:alpha-L-fucosidase [Chitinivibrionales bacterium]